jgi:hypothetical protein
MRIRIGGFGGLQVLNVLHVAVLDFEPRLCAEYL